MQRRAIDADDLELALHYKNATTVLLQRAELHGAVAREVPGRPRDTQLADVVHLATW